MAWNMHMTKYDGRNRGFPSLPRFRDQGCNGKDPPGMPDLTLYSLFEGNVPDDEGEVMEQLRRERMRISMGAFPGSGTSGISPQGEGRGASGEGARSWTGKEQAACHGSNGHGDP